MIRTSSVRRRLVTARCSSGWQTTRTSGCRNTSSELPALPDTSLGRRVSAGHSIPLGRSKEVANDSVPERLAEGVDGEKGGDHGSGLHALDTFRTPVHVCEAQPHRKLIERQAQSGSEDNRDPEVPRRVTGRERREAGHHQEQHAPEEVVNVQATLRDDVVERATWPQVVMKNRGDQPQDGERGQERDQRTQRHPAAQVETTIVML